MVGSKKDREEELSCNRYRGYRFNGIDKNGERKLLCNNVKGSCQHTACQCDRQLAIALQSLEETWNIAHHVTWGGFDRATSCRVKQIRAQPKPNSCCGDPGNRFPFNNFDGMKQCCGNRLFWKPDACCKNHQIVQKDHPLAPPQKVAVAKAEAKVFLTKKMSNSFCVFYTGVE